MPWLRACLLSFVPASVQWFCMGLSVFSIICASMGAVVVDAQDSERPQSRKRPPCGGVSNKQQIKQARAVFTRVSSVCPCVCAFARTQVSFPRTVLVKQLVAALKARHIFVPGGGGALLVRCRFQGPPK